MAERQHGDKWSLGPAPCTSVAAAEADRVPPSSVSSQETPASSLPHAKTRDEVPAPTPQTADLARENRFATINGANSGDSTREDAEEWSDYEHVTQHFADNGVELDEAENDMATLALNPGMMQDEQIADPSPQMVTDARMAERLVEGGDADLMLRLKAGDLQCFDVLMNKYRRQIVHFMFRMVRNQAVAEEMAQEVFLRVYRARETYRAEAKFTTWLYRIATNLAVNHARDTRNERLAPKVLLDEPEYDSGSMPDVADSTPSAEADMLRRERMNAIKQHVMALPERQRMAVLMHKYEEMDYKSIGTVLKLSESATKSLLFRAYQTLRDKLKDFI